MKKHLTHIAITSIVASFAAVPLTALAATGSHTQHRASGLSAASRTPWCSTSQFRLSLVDQQGAMGTTYWDLALRNVGRTACHMRGYPGVGLLDPHSRLINVQVVRVPGFPESTITLRSGQQAYFSFGYPSLIGACSRHFSAYGVQVIPPNEYARIVLRTSRFDVCTPSAGVGNPGVYPVRLSRSLNG